MSAPDFELDAAVAARLSLDERPGPAARVSSTRALAMVDAALETALGSAAEPAASPRMAPRSRSVMQSLAIAAAVLLALVGGAAAARFYFGMRADALGSGMNPSSAVAATGRASTQVVSSTQPAQVASVVQVGAYPASVAVPRAAPPASPTDAHDDASYNDSLHGAAVTRGQSGEHAAPDDLLQKANRLRADGRFGAAASTYALVYDRHPGTLSAYVAEVAAGSIELEHLGRPARARVLFEQALRSAPNAALDIEARQGLALSLRDVGDRAAELRALQALVHAHPQSPAAARARARLQELGRNAR